MTRIAAMQGYFLPYAGYFRLMCDVDAFVICGSVQFTFHSWINRNQLRDNLGRLRWLTLPLAPCPTSTPITDIRFSRNAADFLRKTAARFAACRTPREHTAAIVQQALAAQSTPWETIERLLRTVHSVLGFSAPLIRDTDLRLPAGISREERIFLTCEQLSADTYLNAPGGRDLYDPDAFRRRGLKLEFLPFYRGDCASILQRLHDSSPAEIHAEIRRNLVP
jgi:hypothetical protein